MSKEEQEITFKKQKDRMHELNGRAIDLMNDGILSVSEAKLIIAANSKRVEQLNALVLTGQNSKEKRSVSAGLFFVLLYPLLLIKYNIAIFKTK